jgi:hypothetical protein
VNLQNIQVSGCNENDTKVLHFSKLEQDIGLLNARIWRLPFLNKTSSEKLQQEEGPPN